MATDPAVTNPSRLAFLTTPLDKAVRISGTPSVSLRVTLDKPTAILGVLLVDYGQDSRINGVNRGLDNPLKAQGLQFIDGEDCIGESTAWY